MVLLNVCCWGSLTVTITMYYCRRDHSRMVPSFDGVMVRSIMGRLISPANFPRESQYNSGIL